MRTMTIRTLIESTPFLNKDNYLIWKIKMESLFDLRGIMEVMSNQDESVQLDYKINRDIAPFILAKLKPATHTNIIKPGNARNAKSIWIATKTYFASSQSANQAQIFNAFLYLPFSEDRIDKFVTNIQNHINKLTKVGIELPLEILASLILFKFPSNLKAMATQIVHRDREITVDRVLDHLTQHKNKISAKGRDQTTSRVDMNLYNNYPKCKNGTHNPLVQNHSRDKFLIEFPELQPKGF